MAGTVSARFVRVMLNQAFRCDAVPPELMDRLWASGWRHFGSTFFRYSHSPDIDGVRTITPLRLDLARFEPSRSQRRVRRRNADLHWAFAPARLSDEARALFEVHKTRFRDNVPDDLDTFLSPDPAQVPCTCVECRVHLPDGRLIALSYLDVGGQATSAVYGVFDPAFARRSLGIFTMLLEIEHSRALGCRHYYPGYATAEPSPYDYKKQFAGLEQLDWNGGVWRPLGLNPNTI